MRFLKYFVVTFLVLALLTDPGAAGLGKKIRKALKKLKHTIHEAGSVAGSAGAIVAGGAAVGSAVG